MTFSQAVPANFVCFNEIVLTFIELDIRSPEVVTLCFLEQNQHVTSYFLLTSPALIVFN